MHRQFFHSGNSAKITGIITIGPVVRNHISSKWQQDGMQHGELRALRCPWSIDKLFKLIFTYISYNFIAGSRNSNTASRMNWKWECEWWSTRKPVAGTSRNRKPYKNDNDVDVQGNLSHDLPEWLLEFRHGLVDESVPEHRDASRSSHELPSEARAKVVSGKHSIFSHFPKDRKCDICLRTMITRAPFRRRTGTVVPGAVNFGDSITADHKVLSEGCESRNNHRHAIVVSASCICETFKISCLMGRDTIWKAVRITISTDQ